MTRQIRNKLILELLLEANELMPDQRLGQLLVNCGITHDVSAQLEGWQAPVNIVSYNEESSEVLDRIIKVVERLLDANSKKV